MTIFSDNPHDRRIERFMTAIPNFKPRGIGVRFSESQVLITITAATPTEILAETMRQIRCPPFRKRFNEYIESEENPMTYINEKHRARFTLAAKNIPKANYALLSALYLLTVDPRLWSCCKHHINNGCVFFENIKLNNCTERAYTLYCAAKDLTLGTKHITVSDLSDADLVPPMLFRTICNAMAIRSFIIAAENGNDYAEYQLGKIYLYGKDIPRDTDKAMYYLHLAVEHGNQYAAQLIHSIKVNGNWTAALASLRLLGHMARIIQNRLEDERRGRENSIDRKLRRKIEEKKQAHGLKQ